MVLGEQVYNTNVFNENEGWHFVITPGEYREVKLDS